MMGNDFGKLMVPKRKKGAKTSSYTEWERETVRRANAIGRDTCLSTSDLQGAAYFGESCLFSFAHCNTTETEKPALL